MASWVRNIYGKVICIPQLYPSELKQLDEIIDLLEGLLEAKERSITELDAEIDRLETQIVELKDENHELKNQLQAKLNYALLQERIETMDAEKRRSIASWLKRKLGA